MIYKQKSASLHRINFSIYFLFHFNLSVKIIFTVTSHQNMNKGTLPLVLVYVTIAGSLALLQKFH